MKIAIDVSPLENGHRVRGVGFYVKHLKTALEKYFPENAYTYFTRSNKMFDAADVVHYPYFELFFVSLPFLKKTKTVVTVHDLTPIKFPEHFPAGIKGKIKWKIQKYLLIQVDAIITNSENSKKDIIDILHIPKEKVTVTYLAAGEEFKKFQISNFKFQILKKKYNLPDTFVLYVGDVTWNKNLPRLLEAIEQVNMPLVMVGKALVNEDYDRTNPWNKDLLTVQEMIKQNKNITTTGFVSTEDLVLLYNIATVFVMPSLYEGFGFPVLEAMCCGCPVITTRESSLPEVAGDAAYYVDAYSSESIANGIKKIVEDKKMAIELSQKGIQQSKKFSWKKTANKTIAVYKKVYETKST